MDNRLVCRPAVVERIVVVETKPAVVNSRWIPTVVDRREDVSEGEEIYPVVPNPVTVEFRLAIATNPVVMPPVVLTKLSVRPLVVERIEEVSEADEMYPSVPRPVRVELRVGVDKNPAVVNSMRSPPVVDNKLVWRPAVVERIVGVETKSDVR